MVSVHLFKHIYSHEGFHLASGSCRFFKSMPPKHCAPPSQKVWAAHPQKSAPSKTPPPKPDPLPPTHLVYPTSLALARHKSGKLRVIRVCCMFVFCSLPPYIFHMPSLTKLSPCCMRVGACVTTRFDRIRTDSESVPRRSRATTILTLCHDNSDSVSRRSKIDGFVACALDPRAL